MNSGRDWSLERRSRSETGRWLRSEEVTDLKQCPLAQVMSHECMTESGTEHVDKVAGGMAPRQVSHGVQDRENVERRLAGFYDELEISSGRSSSAGWF